MTELELIVDLYSNTQRQGPGSELDTLKALSFVDLDTRNSLQVADIGCGTGGQTFTLAKKLNSSITGVDLFPAFLEEMNQNAKKSGISHRIQPLQASMDDLPFQKESLDLIWAEGAIYNMGFEAGIKNWRQFLKPGGHLAVSEITWITNERPEEIEDYWNAAYPGIDIASNKIKHLEKNGYTLTGYFYLPESSWEEHFYQPLEQVFDPFLKRNSNSKMAKSVVQMHQEEIELYRKYKEYYSYGFYVARKN